MFIIEQGIQLVELYIYNFAVILSHHSYTSFWNNCYGCSKKFHFMKASILKERMWPCITSQRKLYISFVAFLKQQIQHQKRRFCSPNTVCTLHSYAVFVNTTWHKKQYISKCNRKTFLHKTLIEKRCFVFEKS